jgi:hypothetical protein
LHLLAHGLVWNLFSDLGQLRGQTGQRGLGEDQQTSSGTTLLVDATVTLLEEFGYKKKDDGTEPFTPMYVYEAMNQNRKFKSMLVHSCAPSSAVVLLMRAGPLRIGRTTAGCRRT